MNQLRSIFQSLKKHSKLTLINVLCMSLGLVAAGIILAFVYQEFNYDSENIRSERIFRGIIEEEGEQTPYTFAPLAEALKTDFPEIENSIRVSFFYGYLACSTSENKFNEPGAIFADSDFFTVSYFKTNSGFFFTLRTNNHYI